MNYTKGPWKIDHYEISKKDGFIYSENDNQRICDIILTNRGLINANLISVAPEMYELLQIVYACLSRPDTERDENRVVNMINSLLARIEEK